MNEADTESRFPTRTNSSTLLVVGLEENRGCRVSQSWFKSWFGFLLMEEDAGRGMSIFQSQSLGECNTCHVLHKELL